MHVPVKGKAPGDKDSTLSLDFVNLRHEIEGYSDNSRIPKTNEIGTLEQDAHRRDLTINSLFYNIKNRSVEDPTGRGISDLKSGKIATPLAARTTFSDDPLRVLRAIRFGARFEFSLDEELKVAAACDEVKAALGNKEKISRERIGAEIDLMMSCNQPVKAMKYMSDLTLFRVIFSVPAEFEPRLSIAYLDATWSFIQSIDSYTFDIEQRRLFLYAALFLHLRETTCMDQMGKKIPVVSHIFRESLKRKDNDARTVVKIHQSLEKFMCLIPMLLYNEDISLGEDVCCVAELTDVSINSKLRVATGFLLREVKEFWPVALWLSLLIYSSDIDGFINNEVDLAKKIDLYKAIKNRIVELGLEKVWDVKNLVKGDKIMSVLQPIARKELIGEWTKKALAWQLAHPSGNADECLEWIWQTNSKRPRMDIAS